MKSINNFEINPIGIGTWMVGSKRNPETQEVVPDISDDQKYIEAINYSLEKGQNHMDTAELYGQGHTEEIVGQAIQNKERSKLFLASKLWRTHYKQADVLPAVKEMLARLQTTYLDLLYVHTPDTDVPMAEYIAGIDDAIDQGLVHSFGVSNFNLVQMKQAMDLARHPIVALQNRYNVLYKTEVSSELLEFCNQNSITLVAYRPVERGEVSNNQTIVKIAQKYDVPPAQIALAWLIQQKGVVAIPKATSREHVDENLQSLNLELAESEIVELNDISSIT